MQKKEIAVSKTSEYEQKYVEERLEIFKQIKEDMALYLQREREFNEKYNSDGRRDFHAEESKLKYKLSEVKKNASFFPSNAYSQPINFILSFIS